MSSGRRPRSLAEVAEWSASMNEDSYLLADFLHEFEARPSPGMFADEPRSLSGVFAGGDVCDAYLAAVAATLVRCVNASRPEWADRPERYLRTPWFASPGPLMRAYLLLESPAAFRSRNLFVTANALSVA